MPGATGAALKSPLGPLFGGAEITACARAARPKLRASEQRAGVGHQGTPKKWPGTPIQVTRTQPSSAISSCEMTKNRSSGM